MTRSELVTKLHAKYPYLTLGDINAAVDAITAAIADTLSSGNRVEIRGFGSFKINRRPPRIGRNPKSGETVQVPEKRVTHFKPGLELRNRVQNNLGVK